MDFQNVWRRIILCEGQEFTTITGLPFTYRIEDNYVIPDRTEFRLAKSNFEKAAAIKNLQGPGQINFISMGPSYVYSILSDERIKYDNGSKKPKLPGSIQMHGNSTSKPVLKQMLVEAINRYVRVNGSGLVMSGAEVLKIAQLSDKSRSIFPSDYCYNRYNIALKTFDGPFLFEYIGVNQYRVLGEHYQYTGDIIHKPRSGNEYVIGQWKNGSRVMFQHSEYGSRNRETLKYKNTVLALIHEGNETVVYTSRHLSEDIRKIKAIFADAEFKNPEIVVNPAFEKNPHDTYYAKCDFRSEVDTDLIRSAIVISFISIQNAEEDSSIESLIHEEKNLENYINEHNIEGADRNIIAKARVNQGVFRERLIRKYKKCCLCGADNLDLLIASHIKPWSDSNPKERIDVNNGLLLCPNHDRLFDKGYISFDHNGEILISSLLSEINRIYMNVDSEMSIDMSTETKEYMKYHRSINKDKL